MACLPLIYNLVATMLDAGCLTNPLKLQHSLLFLSLHIKTYYAICFVTEGGKEAKQTNAGGKNYHYMHVLNI